MLFCGGAPENPMRFRVEVLTGVLVGCTALIFHSGCAGSCCAMQKRDHIFLGRRDLLWLASKVPVPALSPEGDVTRCLLRVSLGVGREAGGLPAPRVWGLGGQQVLAEPPVPGEWPARRWELCQAGACRG